MNKGFDKETFKRSVVDNVKNMFRRTIDEATPQQVFQAVAYAVKDVIIDEWIATHKEYEKKDVKTVYYLSMEFLMGRALGNNIINICARDEIKEALDEMGCEIPTTWEELKEVANKCTIVENGETKRYGLSVPFDQWEFFALIQQAGGKFFNEDQTGLGCLEDGTAKEAFSFMKDLQDSGALYYNDPANDQDNQMFTSGMAAMTINSSGAITSRRETIGDSFEYVVAPLVKGKIESMPTGGNGFGILAASKEQDAAWKFMKWFIEDEKGGLAFVIGSGYLPFTKTMAQSDAIQNLWKESDNYKIAYDALQYGDDSYRIANLTPVIAEFRTCIQAIMLDNQDIDQSLKTFSDSVDIILND